ncbi:MAG: peptide-methionine (R)-S-oxide reductase MsrB [Alphaproteobacteria bacterium]|nr:peptide-methionine (R)-S-oxide reductase MsrB [Alphaproteobacteria bacterium]
MNPTTTARLITSALVFGATTFALAAAPKVTPLTVADSHLASLDADAVDWSVKDLPYWQSVLSEEQVRVCRQAGTERAFTGGLLEAEHTGVFRCSSCGQALFDAHTKFDSGTGWPSFYDDIDGAVSKHSDVSYGMVRTEVKCSRCDAHLGHVFEDGPKPTGLRYCINSVCLLHDAEGSAAKKPSPAAGSQHR